MNAYLDASLAVLEEMLDDLVELIRPLGDDALNWAPLPDGTNSIAVLVVHTVGSTEAWLSRATGVEPTRDRDAEFRARGSAADLVSLAERCRTKVRSLLAGSSPIDPSREVSVYRLRGNVDTRVTAAWCVEHALAHAGEHWGQIQLTAQLFAARPGA